LQFTIQTAWRRVDLTEADHPPQDDRQLVEAALRDRHAFALLVLRYEAVLGRYVRRLLGRNAQSAEDILQETFIKAYVNLNDYDKSRPFSPWIYRIAHNEAIGFLRKRKSESQTINGEDALLILERVSDGENPDAAWQQKRTAGEVRKAVSDLDRRYRDVLVLRYLEEKSYDEIADILEMPPGTVATLISRGLKQLKAPLRTSWGTV
jgi:RNA polymerase sigma-70 factor, ECF subfamily